MPNFKYRSGTRVTLNGMPGIWKIYSPHPVKDHYYCEPADPDSHALMSLAPSGPPVKSNGELVFSPGPTCEVETEWGMVKAHTREIDPVPLTDTTLTKE